MSLGNALSGLMGGTPVTGVLVRTGVNISSGATDKTSQFLNSLVVLFITLLFMPAFVYIPLPCIGAILIVAASRLFPYTVMKDLWAYDKAEFLVLLFTCGICVFEDGAIGLMVGGVVSILRTAIKTQRGRSIRQKMVDETLVLEFEGQISYVNSL
jgi:MFS superfamily sulfate permease-like transporter